ncbi:MAG: N-acetylmuramoyl-L-alanine amidase [Bacteroidaceae bacterium]
MKHYFHLVLFFIGFLFVVLQLHAQDYAKAKNGDGIYSFLLRNHRPPGRYYKAFVKLNKKKLGKDNILKLNVSYELPLLTTVSSKRRETKNAIGSYVSEPIFGVKSSKVKVISNKLADACFYVVSGHAGPDPGAIGNIAGHEVHEDEYAYDIVLRMARALIQEGAKVNIIIQDDKDGIRNNAYLSNDKTETCMGKTIPLDQVRRLQQRCSAINELYRKDRKQYKYCRAIFVHVDSRSRGKRQDVFFYYSATSTLGNKLAENMKNTFESKYDRHQPNRGFTGSVSNRNLYVLSHTVPVSVFVELGNIQNTFDQRRLIINSNREALGRWLKDGFIKDIGH